MSTTSETDRRIKRERVLFVIIALVLIFNFVRRLYPVAEQSGSAENIITFLADLGMAVGLIGLGVRILKAIPRESEGRGKWVALLVAGSMAVAGIFVIHANGGPRVGCRRERSIPPRWFLRPFPTKPCRHRQSATAPNQTLLPTVLTLCGS